MCVCVCVAGPGDVWGSRSSKRVVTLLSEVTSTYSRFTKNWIIQDLDHLVFATSARAGYDTWSIFKRSLTGLNSEFFSPRIVVFATDASTCPIISSYVHDLPDSLVMDHQWPTTTCRPTTSTQRPAKLTLATPAYIQVHLCQTPATPMIYTELIRLSTPHMT